MNTLIMIACSPALPESCLDFSDGFSGNQMLLLKRAQPLKIPPQPEVIGPWTVINRILPLPEIDNVTFGFEG